MSSTNMNVTDDSTSVRSPFQLNITNDIRSLSTSSNDHDLSPTSSVTSENTDMLSPKTLMNTSPFTLNVKKSVGLSSSTSLSSNLQNATVIPSSAMSKDGLTPEQKVSELQKENSNLKKDMETKDAKLSSSLKSIKQFWSPELKKERAYRKEESEKLLLLKDKYQIANSQIEEYKNTLEDIEAELNSQQLQINSLSKENNLLLTKLEEIDRLSDELNKQRNDNCKLEEKCAIFENNERERKENDDELFILAKTLDDLDLRYKQQEEELCVKKKIITDLELMLEQRDEFENDNHQSEVDILCKSLGMREDEYMKLEEKFKTCEEEISSLKKKCKQLSIEKTDYDEHVKDLRTARETIGSLEHMLDKQEELYTSTVNDLEKLRKREEGNTDRINELEDLFLAKDKEFDLLQLELKSLEKKLAVSQASVESKNEIKKLNETIIKQQDELNKSYRNNKELERKSNVEETKFKELKLQIENQDTERQMNVEKLKETENSLQVYKTKFEKLDDYLSERETALDSSRSEVKELKENINKLKVGQDQLENELFDKKSQIKRLEKQKEVLRKNKEESVDMKVHNELKDKYIVLQNKHDSNNVSSQRLKTDNNSHVKEIEELKKKLEKQKSEVSSLNKSLDDEIENHTKLQKDMKQVNRVNSELSQELQLQKQKLTEEHTRARAQSIEDKASKSKHLWDELSKKELKIEELEKLSKEKSKQINTLKKNQTVEREKQQLSVNESKKVEEEINVQLNQLKVDLEVRDKRIGMLEDALRESVNIAVEREDIFARHVEIAEDTEKRLSETETDYDRIAVEKAIVNFKNAFLILTLSERDALIASMKVNQKRYVEELFNIKQSTLLSAITEKDDLIGHLELQNTRNKRIEINTLKSEKEKLVADLKDQNNTRMTMLNIDDPDGMIFHELREAPTEQIYEAIRFLSKSSSKLEYYIEDLKTYLREKNIDILENLPSTPRQKNASFERLKKAPSDELLSELKLIDADNRNLKNFVDILLDKL